MMKKNRTDNSSTHKKNNGHVSESRQRTVDVSLDALKARIFGVSKTHAQMFDVAEYKKVTVRMDNGVDKVSDGKKRHSERKKANHAATAVLDGAEGCFEGDVRNIKGSLDENDDAPRLRISNKEK